jgi:arsenate reductase (glutaredoxin)
MIQILHNPRCTKSREGLKFLNDQGIHPEEIRYLDQQLTAQEIKSILRKLGIPAINWIRKNEPVYKALFKHKDLSEDQWVEAMAQNPKLIERPVVINGDKAVIGRPVENIKSIL